MIPTYLAKRFANRFQVIENNTAEQVCQTLTVERAHQIAALLNEEESAKRPTKHLNPDSVPVRA
jgi:hypothetical protein